MSNTTNREFHDTTSAASADSERSEATTDVEPARGDSDAELRRWLIDLLKPSSIEGDLGSFGIYRVRGILGKGGMGVVLRAVEQPLGRPVALKLVLPGAMAKDRAADRFLREARAAAEVLDQRIVPIFAVGEVGGVSYLAMPLLQGESLRRRLARHTKLPLQESLRVARETAEGLAAAHAHGLIHRDIKPDNIWLEDTANGTHVRLLDFGLARHARDDAITVEGVVVGTPRYMAPEQADGREPDPRADLFSLGCVLYEMLSGRRAFAGESVVAVLKNVATHTPPALASVDPEIPAGVAALVDSLLEKDPARRFPTAEKAVEVLRSFEQQNSKSETVSLSIPAAAARRTHRVRRCLVAAACAVAIAGLVGVLLVDRSSGPAQVPEANRQDVPPPVSTADALRVSAFRVHHFAKIDEKRASDRGLVLGVDSFAPRFGDQLEFDVEFSHPAFAYLVALRPDGEMELVLPDREDQPPPKAERIRYPAPARAGDVRYGLTDGVGLWAFVVLASDAPLPAYQQWGEKRPAYWSSIASAGARVYEYDGQRMVIFPPSERVRAKNELALDASTALEKVLRTLKAKVNADVVVGRAFVTKPR